MIGRISQSTIRKVKQHLAETKKERKKPYLSTSKIEGVRRTDLGGIHFRVSMLCVLQMYPGRDTIDIPP